MNAQTKISPTTATIDQLKPGSDRPGGTVNSRKDYAKDDIEARLDSIIAHGLLRPLLVVFGPDSTKPPFFVADGGLSREAIALGVKTKKLAPDYAVKISVSDMDAAAALAASIEANDQVVPPHQVKVFEAFSALTSDHGKTAEEVAKMFRLEPKVVRGYLALGTLSPKIRKAWLDDDIEESTAKAYASSPDHKQQDAVFGKLKGWQKNDADAIRTALVGDQSASAAMIAFVGKDAYEAAGGKVIEDLFGENHTVSDPAMLKKMHDAKVEAKCTELVDQGWKWAEGVTSENRYAEHSWQTVNGGKGASAANKANAGCRVDVDKEGRFSICYGLIRPGDVKKSPKAAGSAKAKVTEAPKGPAKISNALDSRLESTLMRATQDALKGVAQGAKTLEHTLAAVIASQLQPDRGLGYTPSDIRNALKTIRERLPAKLLNDALAKRFDAKAYLSSVPKPFVIKALNEAGFADDAKKLGAGTKAAAWKRALQVVPKTGWLPVELRTSHYTGPGAAKAKPAKKKAR